MEVILLFPGQGSQKPGMAKDLADAFPAARAAMENVDDALGVPLSRLCYDGPEAALTRTESAQPALLAHGAAAWAVVREALTPNVRAAAGHSLGEFTAYHAAGSLALSDAARLVRRRGELMRDSGEQRPGAMAAILGLAEARVESLCRSAADGGVVVPANYNSPEQLVISGDVQAVTRAIELAKEAGAKRAVRLNVSGAFHSPLMGVAEEGLRRALNAVEFAPPRYPVYTNVTAGPAAGLPAMKELLVRQLTAPVRWTALVQRLAERYPDALFVELGPGSVLSNLVRRIAPSARTASAGTVSAIEQLLRYAA